MSDRDTMLRAGDRRWDEVEGDRSAPTSAEDALRRGLALSALAVRLKQAGRRAYDARRA